MEEMVKQRQNLLKILAAAIFLLLAIFVTLLKRWEPSGECWGYWLFARIFAETGRFIIIDRGPIYVLYLNAFRWLGYPFSVITEYAVTSFIVLASMIVLFRRHVGLGLAVLSAFLWLPFLQEAPPPTSNLALGVSCLAFLCRTAKGGRFKFALSYSLLGLAYLLRCAYIVFILTFVIWDSINFIKKKKKKIRAFFAQLRPRLSDWPIIAILVLLGWFSLMQSNHPCNNAWFADSKWFPGNEKSLMDASFIQHCSWRYIYDKYGSFENKDFYFTNQEIFSGANSMLEAITANPVFVAKHIIRNIKKSFCVISSLTMLPKFFYEEPDIKTKFYYLKLLFIVFPFVLLIFYGSLRACNERQLFLFIIANILVIAAANIAYAKYRYMQPLIPVLVMSAFWYGKVLSSISTRYLSKYSQRLRANVSYVIIGIIFVLFSNGLRDWGRILKDVTADIRTGQIAIMEPRQDSLKASFGEIRALVKDCKGVLSFESNFFSAFLDIPLANIHSVWEIPPFGSLDDSDYNGLKTGRIDCVMISDELATGIGFGTNYRIRYLNYIAPYVEKLKHKGAQVYDIKRYGKVVVLK